MDPITLSESTSCITPPRKKRTWTPGSATNAYSAKRRRISSASVDLTNSIGLPSGGTVVKSTRKADRFIATHPDFASLTTTPRTNRIARVFGLIDDKVLTYSDKSGAAYSSSPELFSDIRRNFTELLATHAKVSPLSAKTHLGNRQTFILALDSPGVCKDAYAYPISWSGRDQNSIAVACDRDVYYQNLDTREVTHLFKLSQPRCGELITIEWCPGEQHLLCTGSSTGDVQLWDVKEGQQVRTWQDRDMLDVGGMNWKGSQLAVGKADGTITFYDSRMGEDVGELTQHKSKVLGCKWSHDGNYLATGDQQGSVFIWDARANKILSNHERIGGRIRHDAPVKAIAWCPWQTDLFATGSTYPDGKIRIFSTKSISALPIPQHTISVNSSVTSLQWSPHCKELLSTHGSSWDPALSSSSSRPVLRKSPMSNSITVHSFPSCQRIVSVLAHNGAVGHSCLSPDGTKVFTYSAVEEAMKMWKIWGAPEPKKATTTFGTCSIR